MTQRWTRLTYLHWPYDPADVRPQLPAGTEPDIWEGRTWIGLIAFLMRDVQLLGSPPASRLSTFLETNVRAYALDGRGRRSVVFLSLDASRLIPVAIARAAYRLPYIWSTMRMRDEGGTVTYRTHRHDARSLIRVRVGEPVAATPLDDFLTARWGLQSRWYGTTSYVPIHHEPWPLRAAELLELDDDLIAASGLPRPVGSPRVLYSDGVEVHLGAPQRL